MMEIRIRCSDVKVEPSDASGFVVTAEVCDASKLESIARFADTRWPDYCHGCERPCEFAGASPSTGAQRCRECLDRERLSDELKKCREERQGAQDERDELLSCALDVHVRLAPIAGRERVVLDNHEDPKRVAASQIVTLAAEALTVTNSLRREKTAALKEFAGVSDRLAAAERTVRRYEEVAVLDDSVLAHPDGSATKLVDKLKLGELFEQRDDARRELNEEREKIGRERQAFGEILGTFSVARMIAERRFDSAWALLHDLAPYLKSGDMMPSELFRRLAAYTAKETESDPRRAQGGDSNAEGSGA